MKNSFVHKILSCVLFLSISGCSVVNFSGNYYDLPSQTPTEVSRMWHQITRDLPLKYSYKYTVLKDPQFKKSCGIPALAGDTVIIPEKFLAYTYQNYYKHRMIILTSVIVHEICHREYDLPSTPPETHFEVDRRAIALLGKGNLSPTYYYQSLYVMKNYWFARKGLAGHAFNAGWNAANMATLALFGHARFADWFATDLEQRMALIGKHYKLVTHRCFTRSGGP